jgi:hypothetical protein
MPDFMTIGEPDKFIEQLGTGMNRVENYQSIQRGTDGRSGNIIISDDTNRRILIGRSPDDNRIGIWVSKPGQDVIRLLGGV